jgi:hypothetical protein
MQACGRGTVRGRSNVMGEIGENMEKKEMRILVDQ